MEVCTIGLNHSTAARFFGTLRQAGIRRLVDVRLNNRSQLAGFAKREDLEYFLAELCGVQYEHNPLLAPTREILDAYKKHRGSWEDYERRFLDLLAERRIELAMRPEHFDVPTVLLCSESAAERCHRRLVLEYLDRTWGNVRPMHL